MLEKSAKFLDRYQKLTSKEELQKFAIKIAEQGKPIVEECYAKAEGQDTNNYTITVEPNGKTGAALIANGDDVVFREFGAGVDTSVPSDIEGMDLPPISPGSWSATEGTGEYAKYGSWHHKKKKYTGLRPTLGMYRAFKKMQETLGEIFKEGIL